MYLIILILIGLGGWFFYEKSRRKTHSVTPGLHAEVDIPHAQEWELYQNHLSICSKKLRVCMEELNLPYQDHHVDLIETRCYENLSREFLKVNPGFTVPVLIHDGHPVYESHEQIVYAAEHAGGIRALNYSATRKAYEPKFLRWIDVHDYPGRPHHERKKERPAMPHPD